MTASSQELRSSVACGQEYVETKKSTCPGPCGTGTRRAEQSYLFEEANQWGNKFVSTHYTLLGPVYSLIKLPRLLLRPKGTLPRYGVILVNEVD